MSGDALRLVNRFNGFYDIYDGPQLVGRVCSHYDGWTASNVKNDKSRGPYAFSAPTRREAVAMLSAWYDSQRPASPVGGEQQ